MMYNIVWNKADNDLFSNGEFSWIGLLPSQLGANITEVSNNAFAHEIIPIGSLIQRIT